MRFSSKTKIYVYLKKVTTKFRMTLKYINVTDILQKNEKDNHTLQVISIPLNTKGICI